MKRSKTKALIESALMVSLATVLSLIKFVEMPYGGSVTAASMMPIVILSYRNGLGAGLGGGLVYAVLQQLLGLKYLSYFTTWQSVVALIVLDYLVAFTAAGLGGIFKGKHLSQRTALLLGALSVSLIRYLCHTVAGATVWVGLSIPDSAALIYSIGYNATYMIPETLVLAGAVYYVGGIIDFEKDLPTRVAKSALTGGKEEALGALGGLCLLATLVVDVILIAPATQNPESGKFDLSGLGAVNWTAVAVTTAVLALIGICCLVYAKRKAFLIKLKQER